MSNGPTPQWIAALVVIVVCFGPVVVVVFKMGRSPPQSLPFLVAFIARQVVMPLVDIVLDWLTCISYWTEGQQLYGSIILASLVTGTIAVSAVSAYTSAKDYKNLSGVTESHYGTIGKGCIAGLLQFGQIFLGARAVRAWRHITDTPWRAKDAAPTTQAALEDFVELVADIKHSNQFEALYEGGPQLIFQAYFIVQSWDSLSGKLSRFELDGWLRILSPAFSAAGLTLAQLDYLCENSRFLNRQWQRDAPPVMLCVFADLTSHLAMRVFPLVALLHAHMWIGLGMAGAGAIWAALVTRKVARETYPGGGLLEQVGRWEVGSSK